MNEMKYESKVMLFVMGLAHDMQKSGLLKGGHSKLTDKGIAVYDQLVTSGFRPKQKDFEECVRSMGYGITAEGMTAYLEHKNTHGKKA